MVLAEPRCDIAIVLHDLADCGFVLGNDAVVTGKSGGGFRHGAKANLVVVASGDKGGTGCGTHGG